MRKFYNEIFVKENNQPSFSIYKIFRIKIGINNFLLFSMDRGEYSLRDLINNKIKN